jgi:cyclopropane fatty-acyl-phospholipid synthase-like methyltransferase
LDGTSTAILPYLPAILQDAWEFGTSAETVLRLVRRNLPGQAGLRVLDLGCGKGAVAVTLARELGCRCLGIDAVAAFIDVARDKAREFRVASRCRFSQGDIRERVRALGRFDVIVLGAIGPVFGDCRATLDTLAPHLRRGGLVVVDDGYLPDDSAREYPQVLKRGEQLRQIAAAGMRLVDEWVFDRDELRRMNATLFRDLEKRCRELMDLHPEKKELFADYIRRQVEENDVLENRIVCAVLVIGRPGAPAADAPAP